MVPSMTEDFYFDQTDTESPTININSIADIGTEDELVITWSANDNYNLESAEIYYSSDSLDGMEYLDSIDAELGTYTFDVPDSLLTNYSSFIIHVYDGWGNSAVDTSSCFSIYDNTPPIADVISPYEGFSVPEDESFDVEWTF